MLGGGGADTLRQHLRCALRGPTPNSEPQASPHQENSAWPEKRSAAGPATFNTGHSFHLGPAGRRRGPPRPSRETPRAAAAQQ
ncbi:hypothetical protein NDU88_000357 [Pleurodeles waltl]|uniref:Uncharacterized protein n=1 Tax=Pleurodeles waltl TaxID=8319 RepID=A0AAV7V6Q2_PLEWA|nr:hypothetical protein NDU88_000357 [Pleurodeles waltl]